ncbi:outer membrane receptor protein involved in Fe transport [Sphingomonas jejuensis]|uniref:Outer membrane receptor protein involved in Fe transport n=1 Tax=Sphingomonas jejuensis TaxID=904715 RepID=A0ABX0XLC9_9SPHN|nr:TonB-dependent receptor [Sphingomonas jejuensis]NJC33968.1 outer membrane receptor protein involved in Fe transport [Sphingomonas jejuensis]
MSIDMASTRASRPDTARLRPLLLAGGALIAMALPGAAAAQVTSGPAPTPTEQGLQTDPASPASIADADAPQGPDAAGGLGEIVVTARRRVETAQDIPVSLTAITAEQIDARDITSLERIAAATPQLAIGRNATGSGAQLTLRGIGSNSLSIGTEQSIAVIVDSVYYGQGRTINEGFFDLAGVEILKGPQSLFYGKNATAGVISISTANPTDTWEGMARTSYEFNAGKLLGEGYVSGPLTDTLGFRLAVRASKDFDSLFDNRAGPITYNTRDTPTRATVAPNTPHIAGASPDNGPNEREILTRATLVWEPTDRLTATVKANYGWNETMPGTWNYSVFACGTGFSTTSPGVPCTRTFGARVNNLPADIAAQTRYARSDGRNFNEYESWGATGTLEYALDDITIVSVNNYNWNRNKWSNDLDYQSSPTVNIWGTELSKYHAYSSELRASSDFDFPVNFLVGGYYQNTRRDFSQLVLNNGSENSAAPAGYRYVTYAKESFTDGETLSAYGQLLWKIIPSIEVTGGVRYIHETKDSLFVQPYANPRFAGTNYAVNVPLTADQTFTNWSPEATVTWLVTDDITVYGAYKTAYKSGGFSNSSIQTPVTPTDFFTFEPESAAGFEGGVKALLFDRQLSLNIGLYSYEFDDLQVTYLDSALLAYNSVNAGSVTTRGVEADFEFQPRALPGFNLNGSVNYNRARYGDSIAPCYGGQRPSEGCFPNLLAPGTPGQNLDGVPTSDAPLWTASLGTRYEHDLDGDLVLGASVDSRYSASYLVSSFGSPLSRQDAYINLDASVRLRSEVSGLELALIGKNLTNQFIVTGVNDASGSGSGTGTVNGRIADQVGFLAMPRTVQLQLTWRM